MTTGEHLWRWLPHSSAVAQLPQRLSQNRVLVWMTLVAGVTTLAHGLNMFHYPYLGQDEGTYFSQGWAVFHQGRLAPYTYFYDHAPLGWIQMGLWELFANGFGLWNGLGSGRFLMLLFQIGSTLLVLSIGRSVSGRLWVGVLAALLFSLSPYGIYNHRGVLLDNVAAFWVLVSLYLLVAVDVTLRRVWLSAAAIGVAILSKETIVAVAPALALLAFREAPQESKPFALAGWVGVAIAIVSTYPLLALLKGELLPAGAPLAGHSEHVSLFCTLKWQAARSGGGLLSFSGPFWRTAGSWAHADPVLVVGGTAAAAFLLGFRRHYAMTAIGMMTLSLWLFLGRGGVILDFYLVPVLPLLALSLALVVGLVVHGFIARARRTSVRVTCAAGVAVVALGAGWAFVGADQFGSSYGRAWHNLWNERPVDAQMDAIRWSQAHLPPNSRMIVDMYMWLDLHHPDAGAAPRFPNAHYYWKAADDPAIATGTFSNDWRKVDYVITTPPLLTDTRSYQFPLVANAIDHSRSVARFDTGYPVDIRKVDPRLRGDLRIEAKHAQVLNSTERGGSPRC